MNKKFVALLIPLLLVPMTSYAYAHFTDSVVKKYKIHVGSVFLNVTGFHVDAARMPDVDNDGQIFGDELKINIYESADCRWYVEIEANPITGGFVLNTTMNMTNGGKLPFKLRWDVRWDGPFDVDPCFGEPGPTNLTGTLPMPPWSWQMEVWKWNATHGWTGPYGPTMTDYKPGNVIKVIQHVDFKQPDPAIAGSTGPTGWQKTWQCKWIRIWVTFEAEDIYTDVSSWTWPTP